MRKCLFGFATLIVALGLVFSVTACPNKVKETEEVIRRDFETNIPFDRLDEVGFKTEAVQLPESYVNDKVISETKQLYYDFYYSRDINKAKLFNVANIFHSANVIESDVGKDSKATVGYDKLKKANGGADISIGTQFFFGIRVKDQNGILRYEAITKATVFAPFRIEQAGTNAVKIKGLHAIAKNNISASESVTITNVEFTTDGYTKYTLGGASGKVINLDFGEYGTTGNVLVK